MMIQIRYSEVEIEGLDLIQELWKLLRLHVKTITTDFKDQVEQLTFQESKESLLNKSKDGAIRVDLAEDNQNKIKVAYCISTITPEKVGEVDSIYVREEYRSGGIGDQLMKRSLQWMDEKGAESKKFWLQWETRT
jgi:N-acetylglutamate synthase-like GNAT family acetyltransferase